MKTVLITGGSEGLGAALAEVYARQGYDLILNARHADRLTEVRWRLSGRYGVRVEVLPLDLARPGAAEQLYQQVRALHMDIRILVNNAGMGSAGISWETDVDKEEREVLLNDVALMSLTKLFLKDMVQQGCGQILNIGSTAAFQAGPYAACYYASKAFVVRYTEAVAREAKGTGVKVQCFCPGPVRTGFFAKAGSKARGPVLSASQAAEEAVRLSQSSRVILIPGMSSRLMLAAPQKLRVAVLARLKKPQ